MNTTPSPGESVPFHNSSVVVPSECWTVIRFATEASVLRTLRNLTFRWVLAAGEATTVVVVAVVMLAVFVRSGVTVVPLMSTADWWTLTVPAEPVMT
jgi:hypothetical protein